MTHEKNMIEYQDFLQKKNLAMKPGDMLYGKSYCFDKANVHKDFLKSQPKLGDFIPTNEEGEVMKEPTHPESDNGLKILNWHKDMLDYNEALDRVLWKGWEVSHNSNFSISIINKEMQLISFHSITNRCRVGGNEKSTYEQLITSGVKLERIIKL